MPMRSGWLTLFVGVTMVGAGSAWYHANPNDATLVWDRLPMTVSLMGLLAVLVGEYVGPRIGRGLLAPAVLLGCGSVAYWHWSDDLRFYVWIQFTPLLMVPAAMVLFRPRYTHQWVLAAALVLYVLAKLSEFYDHRVFAITHDLLSGHTIKHLLTAAGCYSILAMLRVRCLIADQSDA